MRHLYVHVPFCRRRCTYCDFAIAVRRRVPGPAFVAAVLREAESVDVARVEALATLYLGGGTPSLLPPADLARLIDGLVTRFGIEPDGEITIEANPDDVTGEAVRAWRAAGINRVSVGVQSIGADALAWMHRTHGPADGPAAVERLRRLGMPRVSADVIFGLPEGLGADPLETCRRVVEAGAGHVSAYGLTIEPRTPLARREARGLGVTAPAGESARDFLALHAWLTERRFRHYEISNYAVAGEESRHNRSYWSGAAYLGLGPSAHSFDGRVRWWNVRHWSAYAERTRRGEGLVEDREVLTDEQRRLERAYLSLRQETGGSEEEGGPWNRRAVQEGIDRGWLREGEGRLTCTPEGWLRLDSLIVALTTSPSGG